MFDLENSVDESFSILIDYLSVCGHEDNASFIRNIMFDMTLYSIVTENDFDYESYSESLSDKLDVGEDTNDVVVLEILTESKTLIINNLKDLGIELIPDIELRDLSIIVSGLREVVTSEQSIVAYYSTYLDDDMTTARETLSKLLEIVTSYDFFGKIINVSNGYIDNLRNTLTAISDNVEETDVDLLYKLSKLAVKIGYIPDTELTKDITDNKDVNGSPESLIKEFYVRMWRRKLDEYSTKDAISETVMDLIVTLWLCSSSNDLTTTYTSLVKQSEYELNSKYPYKKFDTLLKEKIAELRL
jgi:methyl-accepting chemotaxis protein